MDFTIKSYRSLIESLQISGYTFLPFRDYITTTNKELRTTDRIIILRHDVDDLKLNSLRFAKIQNELGIKGTYYFRIIPESFDESVIKQIADLGHEIGYHYEEIDIISSRFRVQSSEEELIDEAWILYKENLEKIRKVADVRTICAHGSPLSRFNNNLIWKKYSYKEFGIIGDPDITTDWNEVAYLTDTGRRWNGDSVSVRDKVKSKQNFNFKSTFDIVNNVDKLPDKVMFTIHPERWNDNILMWTEELVTQNIKNVIKKWFFVKHS